MFNVHVHFSEVINGIAQASTMRWSVESIREPTVYILVGLMLILL